MKRILAIASAAAFAIAALGVSPVSAQVSVTGGDLIKLATSSSVYYLGHDAKRYVFPNDHTYFTWYANFNNVKTVSQDQLAAIPIGGNVTYRPGVKMVKITTDPKVYAVSKNGILRAIASEAVAAGLYGSNWNKMIDDVPDPFFINYRVGEPITAAANYEKGTLTAAVPSISIDKLLQDPPAGFIDYRQTIGFSPAAVTLNPGAVVTWVVLDGSLPFIASNPHPSHTDQPGLQSGTLHMGETFSYTYTTVGVWGYHNHNAPSQTGTVTIQ